MLIEQPVNLRKVRVCEMIIFSRRLLKKKSLNIKSKLVQSMQASTWLSNIAFYLQPIGLQTLGVINSESCQKLFPSFFCTANLKWSRCAVQLKSEQMPLYQTGRWFRSAASYRILLEIVYLFLCPSSNQRSTNDRKIEQSNECFFQVLR